MEKPIKFAIGNNEEDMNYPVGIQTFSEILKNEYVYVDKTDLVWRLAHSSKYIFLSRPRRFGKSLLCSTLASYFRGEKELFEGKKIMEMEKDWESYPVIHLDLSTAKNQPSAERLESALVYNMEPYTDKSAILLSTKLSSIFQGFRMFCCLRVSLYLLLRLPVFRSLSALIASSSSIMAGTV